MNLVAAAVLLADTKVLGMTIADLAGKLVFVAVVCIIALVVQRAAVSVSRRVLDKARVPSASILINILRIVVWSLALMTVLEPVFGIQPTALVAALGVGSVALSLGMQDTVSNLIGGLSLMLGKVIEPGDVIKVGDFTGTVTDINWRSTCVADSYGQVDVIPNSVLSKTALVKLSAETSSRAVLQLVVEHGNDLSEVSADLRHQAAERLGEWVDPAREIKLVVLSFDGTGVVAQAIVPLVHGVSADAARTRLAAALTTRPWVRRP